MNDMIGLIVTGHAHFATGVTSALELLAGTLQDVKVIDYEGTQAPEELEAAIASAVDSFTDAAGVLVCTDILGGSPFKAAATIATENPSVRVVTGTNLALLISAYFAHSGATDIDGLVDQVLAEAHTGATKFELIPFAESDEDEEL